MFLPTGADTPRWRLGLGSTLPALPGFIYALAQTHCNFLVPAVIVAIQAEKPPYNPLTKPHRICYIGGNAPAGYLWRVKVPATPA